MPPVRKPTADRLIDAALDLAVKSGRAPSGLAAIAAHAGVSTPALRRVFADRDALIRAWLDRIDRKTPPPDDAFNAEPLRDRLFDAVMRRLDAMEPDRRALQACLCAPSGSTDSTPRLILRSPIAPARHMLAAILEDAGLDAAGIAGRLRMDGLGLAFAAALKIWLQGDRADADAVMATLDKALKNLEAAAGAACRLRRGAATALRCGDRLLRGVRGIAPRCRRPAPDGAENRPS